MGCRKIELQISAMMDGQLSEAEKTDVLAHLQSCPQCRAVHARFTRLQRSLDDELGRLQPPEYLAAALKAQIAREREIELSPSPVQLKAKPFRSGLHSALRPALWLRAAGVAAIFVAAVIAGMQIYRLAHRPPSQETLLTDIVPETAIESTPFEDDIEGYLEKSAIVLTHISNSGAYGGADHPVFEEEKRMARKLLVESKLVAKKIEEDRYTYLRPLVDELEPVLWDVANLDQQRDRESINILRETIDRRDVLFKINMARFASAQPEIRF